MLFFCSTENTNHQAETIVKIATLATAQANARPMANRPGSIYAMATILRDAIAPYFGEAVVCRPDKNLCGVELTYPAVTGDAVILSVISVA